MFKSVRESLTVHSVEVTDQQIVSDTTSRFTAITDAPGFIVGPLGRGDYIEVRVVVTYALSDGLIDRITVKRASAPVTYLSES